MNTGIFVAAAAIGLCAAGAAVLYWRYRGKKVEAIPKAETEEDRFHAAWADLLAENARVFNGLFSGLQRIQEGSSKKPEKVLREWCQRAHYKWEGTQADLLCQRQIVPLIEAGDREGMAKWAKLLLAAASAAGITKETLKKTVLTEENAAHYVEWDGNDIYPEDEVEIVAPAWYQNGKLLEQGQCKKVDPEEA